MLNMRHCVLGVATMTDVVRTVGCRLAVAVVAVAAAGWTGASRADVGDPLNTVRYKHQMQMTFAGYTGTSALTNFPALVVFHTGISGFSYAQFQPGAADLRFTDAAGFELAYEKDTWNDAGNSYVWVRVPRLDAATNLIHAHWGNLSASAPAYATNGTTWPTYAGVWHLREPAAADSSAPAYNGVANGTTNVAGLIGTAQDFTGSGWINIAAVAPAVDSSAFTFSALVKTTNPGNSADGISIASVSTSNKRNGRIWWRSGSTAAGLGEVNVVDGDTTLAIDSNYRVDDGAWHSVDYVRSGSTGTLYVDGVQRGSPHTATATSATDLWSIGQRYNRISGAPSLWFIGQMDEVRLNGAACSADWIKAADATARDNAGFTTYSAVETMPQTGSAFFGW